MTTTEDAGADLPPGIAELKRRAAIWRAGGNPTLVYEQAVDEYEAARAEGQRQGRADGHKEGVLKAVARFKFHIRNEMVSLNSLMELALELEREVGVDRLAQAIQEKAQ